MNILFAQPSVPACGTLVLLVGLERVLGSSGREIDQATGGMLVRAMAASRFTGKKEETLEVLAPTGLALARLLLLGVGKVEELGEVGFEAVGGNAMAFLSRTRETEAALWLELPDGTDVTPAQAAAVGLGARLRAYRFDRYRTTEKPDQKPCLNSLSILVRQDAVARQVFADLEPLLAGVTLARDLVSEPANHLTPIKLAARCAALADLGLEIEVLDEHRMAQLNMGALLGVAQGSANPPRLVVLRWRGDPEASDQKPIALVGKGVTFDSGGISLKPGAGMEDMKWDMAGAAVVIGTLRTLAGRKARVNVVGVIGLVENMPSGTAQRPGDVVTSASGKTIEVINTDAEGRLVLADALWYAQNTFQPKTIIDLATLTGAIVIALGYEQAGLFTNNDVLASQLSAAGTAVGEALWRLPMGEVYDKELNSDIADVKNVSADRAAGSITGAQFLKRFVDDLPWAHIDIAGVTWAKKDKATVPKGGSGFGVRLLDRFIASIAEGQGR